MLSTRTTKKVSTTVAFAVSIVISSSGQCADVFWLGPDEEGSSVWNDPANWDQDGAIPLAGDNVFLQFPNGNFSSIVQYINPGNNPVLGSITITGNDDGDAEVGEDMTLDQQQDALTVSSLLVDGFNGQQGFYNLGGTAVLSVINNAVIGNSGIGTFNQNGGTHTVGGALALGNTAGGSSGTYNLNAGSLTVSGLESTGGLSTGTFNQSGGTNTSQIEEIGVGGPGTYAQSGGTHTVQSDLTIGGEVTRNNQDFSGSGSYDQTGGDTTVGGNLILGNSVGTNGTYNLSDSGSLTTGSEIIGNAGAGTFNQSGGAHIVGDTLILGDSVGSTGVYNLTGGSLTAANAVSVGGGGSGTFNYSGGTLNSDLINSGTVNLSGTGNRIFDGDVTNQGIFNVTDTTAVYNGVFDNQGAYFSDPSVNDFQNLNVGPQGYLVAGPDDTFIVRGNFTNSSTQNTIWNTEQSNLRFAASSNPPTNGTAHRLDLPSVDVGPSTSGFQNNFAWGQVILDSGERLALFDGNGTPGAALYTRRFILGSGLTQLSGISGDYNIYYDPDLAENQYLSGNAFNFGSGIGQLIPEGFTFLPAIPTPGITSNEQSFAGALNSACSFATGVLAIRCRELRVLDTAQRLEAVASLTPIQQLSQIATPIKLNFARMEAPMLRMAQLRSGHVQSASLSINGYQIPLGKFVSTLSRNAPGGAAGDDNGTDEPFRDKPFGVFVQGKLDFGNQTNNLESFGFNVDSRAVTVGSDYQFTDNFVAGAAIEYNNANTSFHHDGGSMETDTIIGALYSSFYLPQDFYVDGLATFGNNHYALTRTFNYPGFASSAASSPDAFQYAFAVTTGKDLAWRQWLFSPYTRFEYIQMEIDGYQESGGNGFAMNVGSQSVSSAVSTLGTQVSYNFSQSWGILIPSIRVEWEHQYLNNNQNIPMTLVSAAAGTGNFAIQTGEPDRDYVNLGGSISATLPEGGSAFLRYEARLGQSDISNHIVEVGIKITF